MKQLLVMDVLPDVAAELERLIREADETALAAQIPSLRLVDRCRCGDDFCAMFYATKPPAGAWGAGHRNVALQPHHGILVLDVVNERITAVEILFRADIRDQLLRLLP